MGQKSTLAIQRKLKGAENKTHSRAPTKSRTYNMSFDVSEVVVHTDHLGKESENLSPINFDRVDSKLSRRLKSIIRESEQSSMAATNTFMRSHAQLSNSEKI